MFVFLKQKLTSEITIIFFLILLLLPLTFIGNTNTHDWGDDFAAFIHQAKKINAGEHFWKTGFIANQEKPDLVASPVGFSLVLSPIIYVFGVDFSALKYFQFLFIALWSIWLFKSFQKAVGVITTSVIILCFFYHPQMLVFKNEILSDLCFSFLICYSLYTYTNLKTLKSWEVALLICSTTLAILCRTIGALLLPSFFLFLFFENNSVKIKSILIILVSVSFYALLTEVIFPCPKLLNHYTSFFGKDLIYNLSENVSYNFDIIREFLVPGNESTLLKIIVLSVFISLLYQVFKKNIFAFFCIAYIVVILLWPFRSQGSRYLYPILPILIFLWSSSILSLFQKKWVGKVVVLVMIFFYINAQLPHFYDYKKTEEYLAKKGVTSKEAKELFQKTQECASPEEPVIFTKARALALFTDRKTLYPIVSSSYKTDLDFYKKYNAKWFVGTKDNSLETYKPSFQHQLDSLPLKYHWQNEFFVLYKMND